MNTPTPFRLDGRRALVTGGASGIGEQACRVLTAAGEQWTAMRSDVFEALADHDRPASAYDIAEAVGKRRGKRVAANSVYRILDLFVRTNLANRVESANAYVATAASGAPATAGDATLKQGVLEASNVDVGDAMVELIDAQRAYQFASKAITTTDEMMQIANGVRR